MALSFKACYSLCKQPTTSLTLRRNFQHLPSRKASTPFVRPQYPRFTSTQTASYAPPPPPRRLRRVLIYTALSLTSLSLGAYLASHPLTKTLLASLSPSSSPSSLAYIPPTERAAHINALIDAHPLTQHLRSLPHEWTESRPHASMPEAMRAHSLTASTLAGDTKIPVPPLIFTKGNGEELVAISYLGADLCGHVGIVHGGLLATMLDEGLARCCFAALPNKVGVTARLEINYKRPCHSEGFVVLKARTGKVEGRKAWVEGRVERLVVGKEKGAMSAAGEGKGTPFEDVGEVLVEAKGLFVEPKWAKSLPAFVRPPT